MQRDNIQLSFETSVHRQCCGRCWKISSIKKTRNNNSSIVHSTYRWGLKIFIIPIIGWPSIPKNSTNSCRKMCLENEWSNANDHTDDPYLLPTLDHVHFSKMLIMIFSFDHVIIPINATWNTMKHHFTFSLSPKSWWTDESRRNFNEKTRNNYKFGT